MIRNQFCSLLLVLFISVILSSGLQAFQNENIALTVTVTDNYTDQPVSNTSVRLLQNGEVIGSATTNENGIAEIIALLTSTEDISDLPETFRVSENYPNPFIGNTQVNLSVDKSQLINADVYNVIGQRVASLQFRLNPGSYTIKSSLGHLPIGTYFMRIQGQELRTIKMTKIGDQIVSSNAPILVSPASDQRFSGDNRVVKKAGSQVTLSVQNSSYDGLEQNLTIGSDTTLTVELSRNNRVIFRVSDEESPQTNIPIELNIRNGSFNIDITTPDTLLLKSGVYTISANEGQTEAIAEQVEIASVDSTITILTRVKALASNQLLFSGSLTNATTLEGIDRGYVYILDATSSDTLAGPVFADETGSFNNIITFENGRSAQDLSILYRKTGLIDGDEQISITLPDTLEVDASLSPAAAPTATFTFSGDLDTDAPVIFNASASSGASGEELMYSWDFGNGKRGAGDRISYVYTESGNYTVTLTVSGDFGATATFSEQIFISEGITPPATTYLNGEIFNTSLSPLEGVTVSVMGNDISTTSGTDGKVGLGNISAGIPIVVKLTKDGYSPQLLRITPDADSDENFFTATMLQLEDPVRITAVEKGLSMSGKDGSKVSIPVDGLINGSGELVTGAVDLTMTPLDVSTDSIFAFPGGFEAVRTDGERGSLVSFGLADYTFTQGNEVLQMMPGKMATVEIPVYNDELQIGESYPLWTLDEESGLWIEEGAGTIIASASSPTGKAMVTETGHFSWKNIDVYQGGTGFGSSDTYTLVPKCQDTQTDEIITCTLRGKSVNQDGSVAGYAPVVTIPAVGDTELSVPANKEFQLSAYSGSIGSFGTATIPPTAPDETVNLTILLEPRDTLSTIPIAYGDALKGRVSQTEVSRYRFEGQAGDSIRVRLREGVGSEGQGIVTLLDENSEVLKEGDYSDTFARYIFEELPATGSYFIEIITNESERSDFNISLDVYQGPVNQTINYGERVFGFLWPGEVHSYSFQGETDQILEVIARNVEGEGSLAGTVTLRTPNIANSPEIDFFNPNVWVEKLAEKDGTYTLEISGMTSTRFGEYIIDLDTTYLAETGSQIAYGDSLLNQVNSEDDTSEFFFEGEAGDLVRLHIDESYPIETSTDIFVNLKLFHPDGSLLDETTTRQFNSARADAGIGYILPDNGIYRVETTGDANFLEPDGEHFSLLLRKVEDPPTVNFDDTLTTVLQNEVFTEELQINKYTLTGQDQNLLRFQVSADFATRPSGRVLAFDSDNNLMAKGDFRSNRSATFDASLDIMSENDIYTFIVVSRSRDDVKQSTASFFEEYRIDYILADPIEYDQTYPVEIPFSTYQYFYFNNDSVGRDLSLAVIGSGFSTNLLGFRDPDGDFVRASFSRQQNNSPTTLDKEGTYLLYLFSQRSPTADVEVTLADLDPPIPFSTVSNDSLTVGGSLDLPGDIRRFTFTPEATGLLRINLKSAESNSIVSSDYLSLLMNQVNGVFIRPDDTFRNPGNGILYTWEGEVTAGESYIISIYDQLANNLGNFDLTVTLTTN